MMFEPRDWYWATGDGRIWSSGRRTWVTGDDVTLAAWKAADDRVPTRIATAAEISDVLAAHGLILLGPPSTAAVRAEAQRRILALVGVATLSDCLIKQLNASMRATELVNKRAVGDGLSPAEEAEATALQVLANAIKAIRASSNAMEANPPEDYATDAHWPV
jgi:hypothetical protein